jgi:hypothetical protein
MINFIGNSAFNVNEVVVLNGVIESRIRFFGQIFFPFNLIFASRNDTKEKITCSPCKDVSVALNIDLVVVELRVLVIRQLKYVEGSFKIKISQFTRYFTDKNYDFAPLPSHYP